MDITIDKQGRVKRTDGKPLNLSKKDEREIRRLLTFKKRVHIVSPPRKLGTLVTRGIGGFVKRNCLNLSIIKVLSINFSLIFVV